MISVVADVHVHNFPKFGGPLTSGVNRRGWYAVEALHRAVSIANSRGDEDFVVAGDLYDDAKPPPQIVAATMGALKGFRGRKIILKGNHDEFSAAEEDHALGPVGHIENAVVVEHPRRVLTGGRGLVCLPFNKEPVGEWLPAALKLARPGDIVVAHFGIIDADTPKWLLNSHDAFEATALLKLMREHDLPLVVVGNWHNWLSITAHKGNHRIEQVGALTPTGFDNPGKEYGQIVHISSDLRVTRSQVPGIRFYSYDWPVPLDAPLDKNTYLKVEARREDMVEAREWLRSQNIGGFDLHPSKAEASTLAREAGESAARASSVAEAFDAYVQKLAVPDGVNKDNVLRRLRGYVKGAVGA